MNNELSDILNNLDSNLFVPETNEQRNSETDMQVQEELSNIEPIVSGSGLDNAFESKKNRQVNDLETILSEGIQLPNDVVPLPNSTEEILETMPSFLQSVQSEAADSKSNPSEDVELIVLSAPIKATGVLKVMYEKKSGSVDKVESIPLGVLKKDFVKLIAEKELYNRRKK